MKEVSIDFILTKVVNNEGGYQNYKDDKGNYLNGINCGTKYGITPTTALTAQQWGLLPKGNITEQFMRDITLEQAKNIYFHMYFKYIKGEMTPYPINFIHLDTAVHHGCGTANKFFQRTLNAFIVRKKINNNVILRLDGILGNKTFDVFNEYMKTYSPLEFCNVFLDIRLSSFSNTRFYKGWKNRIDKLRKEAYNYYN